MSPNAPLGRISMQIFPSEVAKGTALAVLGLNQ